MPLGFGMPTIGAQGASPLVNTASNYSYPLTSGLMGSLSDGLSAGGTGSAPPGGTNWSNVALQMAGNPKAGPLAAAPIPSGPGIPGAGTGSSGSSVGSTIGGLLTALATNPGLAKLAGNTISTVGSGLGSLFGGSSGIAGGAAEAPQYLSDLTTLAGGSSALAPTMAPVAGIGSSDAAATLASGFDPATASFGADAGAADAGSSAASGAGLMGALGPAMAVAAPLGLLAFAMGTKPWTYNADHANTLATGVNNGLSAMGSQGIGAATNALSILKGNPSLITPTISQQYGITPANVASLYNQSLHSAPTYSGGLSQGKKV